jgi:hypothetical protein
MGSNHEKNRGRKSCVTVPLMQVFIPQYSEEELALMNRQAEIAEKVLFKEY